MSMQIRGRYSVTTIGASSVTLTPVAGREDEDKAGDPNVLGTGTIVVNVGATPSAATWGSSTGRVFIVGFTRVDG